MSFFFLTKKFNSLSSSLMLLVHSPEVESLCVDFACCPCVRLDSLPVPQLHQHSQKSKWRKLCRLATDKQLSAGLNTSLEGCLSLWVREKCNGWMGTMQFHTFTDPTASYILSLCAAEAAAAMLTCCVFPKRTGLKLDISDGTRRSGPLCD